MPLNVTYFRIFCSPSYLFRTNISQIMYLAMKKIHVNFRRTMVIEHGVIFARGPVDKRCWYGACGRSSSLPLIKRSSSQIGYWFFILNNMFKRRESALCGVMGWRFTLGTTCLRVGCDSSHCCIDEVRLTNSSQDSLKICRCYLCSTIIQHC